MTVQNVYAYYYQNTKHVRVLLSQYKTCTYTTITIQNIYVYYYQNTKRVRVPLGTGHIDA
jgi:hypothetical protein